VIQKIIIIRLRRLAAAGFAGTTGRRGINKARGFATPLKCALARHGFNTKNNKLRFMCVSIVFCVVCGVGYLHIMCIIGFFSVGMFT